MTTGALGVRNYACGEKVLSEALRHGVAMINSFPSLLQRCFRPGQFELAFRHKSYVSGGIFPLQEPPL